MDGRSDQYSLACVLFELLAGELPFTGNTAVAIMARKTTQEAPRLQGGPTAVPGGVEQAILRALSREPGDRFDSLETFLAALLGMRASCRPISRPRPRRAAIPAGPSWCCRSPTSVRTRRTST